MSQTEAVPEDHRTRVGAQRREKTRLRLLQCALMVFAKKGPDGAWIEDFIAAAEVSRGTFYNYFRTTSELLGAVTGQLSDEVISVVEPIVQQIEDPAARLGAGTRLYLEMARRYPQWGAFNTRVGARTASRGKLLDEYLMRDIRQGMASGRFDIPDAAVAHDIVLGSIFLGMETLLTEPTHEHHAEHLVAAFLKGMGVPASEAATIAFMPLAQMAPVKGPIFSALEHIARPLRNGKPPAKSPKQAPELKPARSTRTTGY